jgi:hypothetical protein
LKLRELDLPPPLFISRTDTTITLLPVDPILEEFWVSEEEGNVGEIKKR